MKGVVVLLIGVLLLCTPALAATVSVSATDSTAGEKALSTYDCDGANDEVEIGQAITTAGAGGTVILYSGHFSLQDTISPDTSQTMYGQGMDSTILTFTVDRKHISVDVDGVTLRDFQIRGTGYVEFNADHLRFTRLKAYDLDDSYWGAFSGWFSPDGVDVHDVIFDNVYAVDCDRAGFIMQPQTSTWSYTMTNWQYLNSRAINSGRYDQENEWIAGFDFGEFDGTLDNVLVQNCTASGSWESGFHFESSLTITNTLLEDCTAEDNCQKGSTGLYCSGYFTSSQLATTSNFTLRDCYSANNRYGYRVGNQMLCENCNDDYSTYSFMILDRGHFTLDGGTITTDNPQPIYLSGWIHAVDIGGVDIFTHSTSADSAGVYVHPSVSDATQITLHDMTITDTSAPYVLDYGIYNLGTGEVSADNVCVYNAVQQYYGVNIVGPCGGVPPTTPTPTTPVPTVTTHAPVTTAPMTSSKDTTDVFSIMFVLMIAVVALIGPLQKGRR